MGTILRTNFEQGSQQYKYLTRPVYLSASYYLKQFSYCKSTKIVSLSQNTFFTPRFDTIFIVKDEHNEERDMILAKHVMNIHVNAMATEDENSKGELSLSFLKKFINYARSRCGPRISKVCVISRLRNKDIECITLNFLK